MRVVHLTDIHVQARPHLQDLTPKRVLGTVNLYVLGRRTKFSRVAQRAAVAAAVDASPDLVVFTGDLTAQALETEFEEAREILEPVLARFPTVMIPGNHDTYVKEARVGDAMRRHFGRWMGEPLPTLHRFGDVAFLAVETCRPHPLSAGHTDPRQLVRARELLDTMEGSPFVFLTIHYPLCDRRGGTYGPPTRALGNAHELQRFLRTTDRIHAVIHGHEHHGFRTTLPNRAGPIPVLNPGASGYAFLPERDRTSHLNVYDVDAGGLHDVRRLRFDGTRFSPEPGGAYATGR
jgi:3',5'-cyclic AMP phosphodiesterase CpdA